MGRAVTMLTLEVTPVTVAVTSLAARLQPQEHEQTHQTTFTSSDPQYLMVQTNQSGSPLKGSPTNQTIYITTRLQPDNILQPTRLKDKLNIQKLKFDTYPGGAHIQSLLVLYLRCAVLQSRRSILSAHATKEQWWGKHTCGGKHIHLGQS